MVTAVAAVAATWFAAVATATTGFAAVAATTAGLTAVAATVVTAIMTAIAAAIMAAVTATVVTTITAALLAGIDLFTYAVLRCQGIHRLCSTGCSRRWLGDELSGVPFLSPVLAIAVALLLSFGGLNIFAFLGGITLGFARAFFPYVLGFAFASLSCVYALLIFFARTATFTGTFRFL